VDFKVGPIIAVIKVFNSVWMNGFAQKRTTEAQGEQVSSWKVTLSL
jgi:hypothetical protein